MILQVAVATPLDSLFDYLAPESGVQPQPGQRVRVPFGRREQTGVIVRLADHSTVPDNRLRAALEIIDAEPLFDTTTLALLDWAAAYYQHPPGEVFATALPSALRKGAAAEIPTQYLWIATLAGKQTDTEILAKKASVQAKLLNAIVQSDGLAEAELRKLHPGWRKIIANLTDKELIESILADNTATPSSKQISHRN